MSDQVLAKLLGNINVNSVSEGIALAQQDTARIADLASPPIDVPVRYVPAPVEIQGSVKLKVTFAYDQIAGKTLEELKQKVYAVLSGEQSAWLPIVVLGDMELWREQYERPANSSQQGTVSRTRGEDVPEYAGHLEHRDAVDGPESGEFNPS